MTDPAWFPLPDAPLYPATRYACLADRIAGFMDTANDVLLIQGEAVVALEAAASSLGRPGLRAINVVTSLYGAWFGDWLRRAGATVTDVVASPGLPVRPDAVARAFRAAPGAGLLSFVHAESATGILNPISEIMEIARAAGALSVVDAVASFGGHPLHVDTLGIDVAVIGPQKALGGQAGVSAVSVSPRAWAAMNPPGSAPSILSLADQRESWLRTGRGALPGTPSALEFHALEAALARVAAEGMDALVARHSRAARAMRTGVLAMEQKLWVPAESASSLVTALALPESVYATAVAAHAPFPAAMIAPGVGPAAERLLRLNHTGPRAAAASVLVTLSAAAAALNASGIAADGGSALAAAGAVLAAG